MARKDVGPRGAKELAALSQDDDDKKEAKTEVKMEARTENVKKQKSSQNPVKEKDEKTAAKSGNTPDRKHSPASPNVKVAVKGSKRSKCEMTDAKSNFTKDSSPPQKSQMSVYGFPIVSQSTQQDVQFLEDYLSKQPYYHGFIGREDLTGMLNKPGDYIIRLSVQANKNELEKRKKNVAERKVLTNMSREKCAKRDKEKEKEDAKRGLAAEAGKREFVISVFCKDKEKAAPGKPVFSPIRNLVLKRDADGQVHVEPLKKFKTFPEFFTYYQQNTGVCKDADFSLLNPIPLMSWEFKHEDVALQEKRLGEGAFGEVRVGKVKTKDTKKTIEVAVKMLRNSTVVSREQVNELLHEARVMRMMDHKNVLRTYGIAVLNEPLYLMTEMCTCGALREYLQDNKKTVTLADKLNFVLGAARGVEYLHSQKVIHRDLAVRNVLLAEDKTPKISDFGLARVLLDHADRYEMKEQCKIPVRYLAPETLVNFAFSFKTDVFSFGFVIWEIYENGQQPHDGKTANEIKSLTGKNTFLTLPSAAPEQLRTLVKDRVFLADPENRYSMSDIVQAVDKMEKPPPGVMK